MSNSAGETFPTCDCNLCKIATLTAENARMSKEIKAARELLGDCWDMCHSYSLMGEGAPNEAAIKSAAQNLASRIDKARAEAKGSIK